MHTHVRTSRAVQRTSHSRATPLRAAELQRVRRPRLMHVLSSPRFNEMFALSPDQAAGLQRKPGSQHKAGTPKPQKAKPQQEFRRENKNRPREASAKKRPRGVRVVVPSKKQVVLLPAKKPTCNVVAGLSQTYEKKGK
eukprot:m.189902 g.189902  ORF g.189902 m.189902 type:complete len:138 (-) comp18219_c0_seq2:615-1028(-)